MRAGALLLIGLAAPLAAQAQGAGADFDPAALESCLSGADDPASCIGKAAQQCIGDAASVQDRRACYDAERALWSDRAATALDSLRRAAAASDAAKIAAGKSPSGLQGAQLGEAEAAWARYRDGACAYGAALQSEGAEAEEAGCLMRKTAEHALELQSWAGLLAGEARP
ncbi:hypothetical protein B6V73_09405 [Thioclava sp. JM3]|uniref:lysozyme inhibitor LprI family protein n=1 Tax=unclassified Thioclava TaxID=2621713 RepID=UPI000B538CCD|nr:MULTISPECIES: lysozyme inhibitor LprI family protein [unclassified Thioclava]OWY05476.1 hypothetical protein B6V75_04995 [Thioclava sp. F1Mire-8]OWY17054.1 hypothetical protein B6V73_09405 [Thioclava sp. JM3]